MYYVLTIHLLQSLLIFVNVNKHNVVHVHSALMFTNTTCGFNNALVNAEINMN